MKIQYLAQGVPLIEEIDVEVNPLSVLIDRFSSDIPYVDFLSVDIEGLDHAAIATFNFEKYKPLVIAIELHDLNLLNPLSHITVDILNKLGYQLYSHTVCTSIFLRRN